MKRLGDPPYLCLVTPGILSSSNLDTEISTIVETARRAASEGVAMIQIREKDLSVRSLFELTRSIVNGLAEFDTLVLVNGRADIAVAAGADGVHLPGNSIPVSVLRRVFRSDLIIGVSAHSPEDVVAAKSDGADYVYFGPVHSTPEKPDPAGIDALREACDAGAGLPVIGIGGINENNIAEVFRAGASGIAAIRAMNDDEARGRLFDRLAALSVARALR